MNSILFIHLQDFTSKSLEKIKIPFFFTRGSICRPSSKSLDLTPCHPWVTLSDCWYFSSDLWVSSKGSHENVNFNKIINILCTLMWPLSVISFVFSVTKYSRDKWRQLSLKPFPPSTFLQQAIAFIVWTCERLESILWFSMGVSTFNFFSCWYFAIWMW